MKNKILALLLIMLSGMLHAQNTPVDKLFEKYSGKDGYTVINISSQMFGLFAAMSGDDKGAQEAMKGISGIRILAEEKKSATTEFATDIKNLQTKEYTEMMSIKEKKQDIKFLLRLNGKAVSELLMLIAGEENVLICIQGDNINLNTISNLSKTIKVEGMENLEKIEKKE
jgi:hypothetical protein